MLKKLISNTLVNLMVFRGKHTIQDLEKQSKDPMRYNEEILYKILKHNRNTEYGKAHHFADIHSIEEYRAAVPVSPYEEFAPFIDRMLEGETNLLFAGKVIGFSRTSGSSGKPKSIPISLDSFKSYIKYSWSRALAIAVTDLEKKGGKFKPGRGFYTSPTMSNYLPNGMPVSNIVDAGAQYYGDISPFLVTQPTGKAFNINNGDYLYCMYRFALEEEDISFILSTFYTMQISQVAYLQENWPLIVKDIEQGTIDPGIQIDPELRQQITKRIRPKPGRAAYLRKQFEQGFDDTIYKRLWPNLTMFSGIGNASFKSAADQLRRYAKDIPFDFSLYASSEGLMAACYEMENDNMQLCVDSCFFEFIPENDETGTILTLDQIEEGKKYEMVITSTSGFYRYPMKDIVEVVGFRNKIPLVQFAYRKGQLLNVSGEKFTEEDARTTIAMFEKAHHMTIDNWIFYQDNSVNPSRYALITECKDGELGDEYIDELEEIMGYCCERYPQHRGRQNIGRLILQTQEPGTHEAWTESRSKNGAYLFQVKPVHSLDNDAKREFFLSRIKK